MGDNTTGIVAAGHAATAEAAIATLDAGGNAFDAAVASVMAACIAEPMLASLGGGGFLLAQPTEGEAKLYDFFTQTPRRKRTGDLDFYAIEGDFGNAVQEFHIGMGSIATPGMVKGLFRIQEELGRMPITTLIQPAVDLARNGVVVNEVQSYSAEVLAPIVDANDETRRIFDGDPARGRALTLGSRFRLPEMADVLEALADEGADLFYRGDLAEALVSACRAQGGHLTLDDLATYRVERREPLIYMHGSTRLLLNPPPSLGGSLIRLALTLYDAADADHAERIERFALAMELTSRARRETGIDARVIAGEPADPFFAGAALFSDDTMDLYRAAMADGVAALRGTTHVSVIDGEGNVASISVSNGEGCGWLLPGTGIMLNNMLGEEDLAKDGFGKWPEDRRMASMMSPTIANTPDGRIIALGSGGSNRIRSAVLQVLIGMLDDDLDPASAIKRPRIHLENNRLDAEPGIDESTLERLGRRFDEVKAWPSSNMFFGGVHVAERNIKTGRFRGAGDPRRGGRVRQLPDSDSGSASLS